MMRREGKTRIVEEISKKLSTSSMVVFTAVEGLDVASMTELRKKCRIASVSYQVLKNTLATRAFESIQVKGLEDILKGSTALAIGSDDPITAAKVIHEFASTNVKLKIKGGLMGTKRLTAEEVIQLAKLPSRHVLLGQLAGTMKAPMTNLVYVLSAVTRGFVTALKAIEEKNKNHRSSGE